MFQRKFPWGKVAVAFVVGAAAGAATACCSRRSPEEVPEADQERRRRSGRQRREVRQERRQRVAERVGAARWTIREPGARVLWPRLAKPVADSVPGGVFIDPCSVSFGPCAVLVDPVQVPCPRPPATH